MLVNLHVKNLALIEEVDVEFGPGLNILTGETGAGKSILIGSVNLALGKKMVREMIREQGKPALVELVFQIEHPEIIRKLKEMDIEPEDGQIIISRKFTENRSISKLNGETCTASQIRSVAEILLDLHGQHEHQSLLYPAKQLEILDAYGRKDTEPLRKRTGEAYQSYQNIKKELKKYTLNEEERLREQSFLEFEIREIEEAKLQPGEDEELEKQYRKLVHAKQITENLNQAYQMTGYADGAGEQTGRALRELTQAAAYDDGLADLCAALSDIDSLLNDFNRELSARLSDQVFSDEIFYETEKRLDEINRLKAKYGSHLEEIHGYLEKQKQRLEELENFEICKQRLEEKKTEAEKILEESCAQLSRVRKSYAKKLSGEIEKGLEQLNFLDVRFEIGFDRTAAYTPDGYDAVSFRISTNPGEPVRDLQKVVSGGELSRIMLALKTLLADKDEIETLIFDEIDTGISGRTAQMVSEKMAKIGSCRQVICITHLPQIAAMADHHFEIEKHVVNGETRTNIICLDRESAIRELARMLGGAAITDRVLENAKEMKELADVKKTKSEN